MSGKPPGLPGLVLCSPGPPPDSWVLGGREEGEEEERRTGRGTTETRGSGEYVPSISPAHLGPRKPAGLPGLVLHPPEPSLATLFQGR